MATKVSLQDVLDLNKQIYAEIGEMRGEFSSRLEKVENRTSVLEHFKADLGGKIAVLGAAVIIFVNLMIEYVKERIFNKI